MMKNKGFVLIGLSGAAILFFALKFFSPAPLTAKTVDSNLPLGSFIRMHSPEMGNKKAKVIVVEWFDPECESCRAIHPSVKKIVQDYGDRVRFVFRYMPYHPGSMFAASAIEEAREFGKFEEALDVIFEKQPEWGDHRQPRPELIPTYLTALGIPKDKLSEKYLVQKHGEKIRMDESDGKSVGVQGTPTFFVDGKMVLEYGAKPLREAVESALSVTE